MKTLDKETAIARMNTFGRNGTPFLFVIDYMQEHSYVEPLDGIDASVCLYQFRGTGNAPDAGARYAGTIDWEFTPPAPADYRRSFDTVRRNLLGGNSYLTNLTCKVPLRTNLTLKDVFLHSHALYKLWLKDRFVCFSPEIFVCMEEGRIKSFPMKGTIDATLPHAESILLDDAKEAAEHATIVDLIRNDLSMVSEHVTVASYRYIDRLQTNKGPILQTSSEICGMLPAITQSVSAIFCSACCPPAPLPALPNRVPCKSLPKRKATNGDSTPESWAATPTDGWTAPS